MQDLDAAGPTRTIGGISFTHYRSTGAAMSHDTETVFPLGGVRKFTKQDDERVPASLMKIIDSFRVAH